MHMYVQSSANKPNRKWFRLRVGFLPVSQESLEQAEWVGYKRPMPRKLSAIAADWWDYTTLNDDIIRDAAALTPEKMLKLSRPGFKVVFYDTLEEFYLAEALEYVTAWRQSSADHPVGICGPIGPTEQLPLVARLVNELNLNIKSAHFWGMDEWY